MQPITIQTRWAKDVNPERPLPEYPRPQMVREKWQNLNGLWDYAITPKNGVTPSIYEGKILVPYPLESALSGVKKSLLPSQNLWYKRTFDKPNLRTGEHVLLHFGAVDWQVTVYVNGSEIGTHSGGYQAFTEDITNALKDGLNEILVKVFDPTEQGIGPHGKQVLNPANIYYTASSGIWQTVWLETVPVDYIAGLVITPDIDNGILKVNVRAPEHTTVELTAIDGGVVISKVKGRAGVLLNVPIKNAKLWSPEIPFLYDLSIKLIKGRKIVDEVRSYFGMRKIAIQKDEKGIDRIFLNNRPYFNLGILDQGFWPDGLYTAPTDEALKFDIEAIKAMGFNTIRKHIKVEPARWYYHADKIGVLVWQDFVNPNQSLPEGSKSAFEAEMNATIQQLSNAPSITTWVVFNEKWGAYDQQRITELVKNSDPTRIVNGHSGELLYVNGELRSPSPNAWVSSNIADVHSYPDPMNPPQQNGKACVLGEFGGIGVPIEGHLWDDLVTGWGYQGVGTANTLKTEYQKMTDTLLLLKKDGLSASIYTQPYDVESEQNGIMTYDRKVIKMSPGELRAINRKLTDAITSNSSFMSMLGIVTYDSTTEGRKYETLLGLLDGGKRDSAVLRQLALLAFKNGAFVKVRQFTSEYINTVKDLYSDGNLKFLQFVTRSVDDPGFKVFLQNTQKVNATKGANYAEWMIRRWVWESEIKPIVDEGKFDELELLIPVISNKYGVIGAEKLYGVLMMYFIEKENWEKFGKYYSLYFQTATSRSEYHINNISWNVVEHVDDPLILQTALVAMIYNIENFSGDNPYDFDTYAALLFKVGMKNDAVKCQEKAVKLSNNQEVFVNNLSKMKLGKKTW